MTRVAFFLDNNNIASKDCSKAIECNPGIGGTEWLIVVISSLLANRANEIDIVLYTTKNGRFPDGIRRVVVRDLSEAITDADSSGFDYLVIKHLADNITSGVLDVRTSCLHIICWCHIFVSQWELDYYANNDTVSKVVFVGREMYDLYRDHRIYSKTTYIYNCVPLEDSKVHVREFPYNDRGNTIVYVGSLVPFKGFHLLAEAWPRIKQQVPDAELYVIGSAKLYDERSTLGEWGIAEASYEKKFMPFLLKDGRIHPDVHFMGVMGEEKKAVIAKARVGVPNPSGITETFCLSAVEMQIYGCRVATNNYPGYLDTVRNGKLFNRNGNLADTVIDLLSSYEYPYEEAMKYFDSNFSYASVCLKWEELLKTGAIAYEPKLKNMFYRLKWLKEFIRILKRHFSFLSNLPLVERALIYIERKRFGRVTYIDS